MYIFISNDSWLAVYYKASYELSHATHFIRSDPCSVKTMLSLVETINQHNTFIAKLVILKFAFEVGFRNSSLVVNVLNDIRYVKESSTCFIPFIIAYNLRFFGIYRLVNCH